MSRVRANQFTDKAGTGSPTFTKGAIVTGVVTATSFSGSGANLTGIDATSIKDSGGSIKVQANSTGAVVTGVLTATSLVGNVTGTATLAQGLTGSPHITVDSVTSTGIVTGVTGSFSGNVSIGGTLTYEDVTNIDSVGLITAREGIDSVGLITAREGVFIPDSKEIKIGNTAASPDLKLYHNGSHSFIKNITGNLNITNTGSNTIINSDLIVFQSGDQGETIARFVDDGTCELWFNNTKVFETVNLGAKVTGGLEVTGVTTASSYSGRHAEVPKNAKSGAYTLLKTDSGQCISTNSAVTVPNAVFASGDAITVFNDSASAIALTQGSGLQLRKAGSSTTGNLSIKEFGLVTIWFNTGGTAIASGNLA